jgi:DNA adenine methylase
VSPLRYPGGKGKLTGFIKLFMLENGLVGADYVEPYAGGASVALSLLFEDYVSDVYINDIDRSIAAFWRVVTTDAEALCDRIMRADVTVDEWRRQRSIQDEPKVAELDLAFSTFFLNRTSRSGIIKGGVIGGLKQTGRWKIDARFNRADLVRRIKKIARHRSRIHVTAMDAGRYIEQQLPDLESAFVYLDPPYYRKGKELYTNAYKHDDHHTIASLVGTIKHPWLVSYDATPEIRQLYMGYEVYEYGLVYSANARYEGTEVMVMQPGLKRPSVVSPANVSWRVVDKARMNRLV